ncbi:hypothetical protein [Desulfonatronovibrio magnus]|uniref:hypothetical protein n=1 Tax=Desulfonatronovibrio magnus TaxID=698827 RepID=UPI0005EB5B8B|nr:hypothetical protein [Desulfonatronovibrio magnus]
MGELIQIRVTAGIHDREKAVRRWSGLYRIAFDQDPDQDMSRSEFMVELIDALYDRMRLGQLPKAYQNLEKDIETVYKNKAKLQSFLADRNPQEADKISYLLEDGLDRMQEVVND